MTNGDECAWRLRHYRPRRGAPPSRGECGSDPGHREVAHRRCAGELTDQEARIAPGRESERWTEGVALAEAAVAGQSQLVHVMDSEGDNDELMTALVGEQRRLVIRLGQDRLVEGVEGKQKVSEFLALAAVAAKRRVSVSRRTANLSSHKDRRRAARPEREASLAIHATALVVRLASAQPAPSVV